MIARFTCTALVFILFLSNALLAQTSYAGKVVDAETQKGLPFATVSVKNSDRATVTDIDGNFFLLNAPDSTALLVSFVGYKTVEARIDESNTDYIKIELKAGVDLDEVVVIDYRVPLIDIDNTTTGITIAKEEIISIPARDVTAISATAAGVSAVKDAEAVAIRGSRSDATDFYVDGVRMKADKKASRKKRKREAADAPFADDMSYEADLAASEDAVSDDEELPAAGQLTAGEVNDFSKWDLWSDLRDEDLAQFRSLWGYAPEKRYVTQLTHAGGGPVVDAVVVLQDRGGRAIYSARTDNQGRAELWAELFPLQQKASGQLQLKAKVDDLWLDLPTAVPFEQGINALEVALPCERKTAVEVAFVVDATGSMGDEMAYLKSELLDVMHRSQDSLGGQSLDFGAVYYRDNNEEYVTRHLPFGEPFETVVDFAAHQSAGGGGDHPEAVDAALEVALKQLNWSESAAARLLFLVLDAPPHSDEATIAKMQAMGQLAAEKGVRIIPVVCSGMGQDGEYLLRSMALATNGTYTFLTDHSGIGNSHLEPSTDSYEVEKLNDLLVRLITQFGKTVGCDALNPSPVLPIKQPVAEDWSVFPNPTTGPVTATLPHRGGYLYVVDGYGKILQRIEVESKKQLVQFGQLPSGTYLLRYEYKDQVSTRKVIVTR